MIGLNNSTAFFHVQRIKSPRETFHQLLSKSLFDLFILISSFAHFKFTLWIVWVLHSMKSRFFCASVFMVSLSMNGTSMEWGLSGPTLSAFSAYSSFFVPLHSSSGLCSVYVSFFYTFSAPTICNPHSYIFGYMY